MQKREVVVSICYWNDMYQPMQPKPSQNWIYFLKRWDYDSILVTKMEDHVLYKRHSSCIHVFWWLNFGIPWMTDRVYHIDNNGFLTVDFISNFGTQPASCLLSSYLNSWFSTATIKHHMRQWFHLDYFVCIK